MDTFYEIKQYICSVDKGWLQTIRTIKVERLAKLEFNDLVKNYPDEYFELIEINVSKKCLSFTPKINPI